MPKVFRVSLYMSILLLLAACEAKPVCPTRIDTPEYLSPLDLVTLSTSVPENSSSSTDVEISGKTMTVDKVVTGPLCNDNWKGIVYVSCDVQVFEWADQPLFLKDCNLSIEPGTVVFVAAHNDTAYYNGCSCHTGGEPME